MSLQRVSHNTQGRGKKNAGRRTGTADIPNHLRSCIVTLRLQSSKSFDEIYEITGVKKSAASRIVLEAQRRAGKDASFSDILAQAQLRPRPGPKPKIKRAMTTEKLN